MSFHFRSGSGFVEFIGDFYLISVTGTEYKGEVRKLDLLRERAKYKLLLRQFFSEEKFLEVTTPLLVTNPGLEPNIRYFETEFKPIMGRGETQTLYLPTSPEYHLKKALAWGAERIFEITRSFRNGELGVQHRPEFEMLEWYRQPGTYEDIARDVQKLFECLWRGFNSTPCPPFRHKKVQEFFFELANIDLEKAQKDLGYFHTQLKSIGVEYSHTDSFEDLFHRVFLEKIEVTFSRKEILFLWDFPAPLRALSKLSANPYFCKRFEVYWGAVELGNAFDELVDPTELERVCRADQTRRQDRYGKAPPLDQEFIAAHHDLNPQMGGIAMGIDRIFQWLHDAEDLDSLMLFESINFDKN